MCASARAVSDTWEWRLMVSSSDGWGTRETEQEKEKSQTKEERKINFFRETGKPSGKLFLGCIFSNCYLCYSHIRKLINYLARSFFLNIQARLHKWARPTPPQFLVWLPGRIFKTLYQVTNSMFEHVWLMSYVHIYLGSRQSFVTIVTANTRVRAMVFTGIEIFHAKQTNIHVNKDTRDTQLKWSNITFERFKTFIQQSTGNHVNKLGRKKKSRSVLKTLFWVKRLSFCALRFSHFY